MNYLTTCVRFRSQSGFGKTHGNKTQPPAKVINFQARERATSGSVIPDGQRNNDLFKVGCAIWGKGEAEHLPDLHGQMLGVNARRCSPPLDDAEVAQLAANIAARYVRGVPINNPVYTEDAPEQRERVTLRHKAER
jgi:hypothetical protein